MLKEVADIINSQVSGANATVEEREVGDHVLFVDPAHILGVCEVLKSNQKYPFKVLEVITGTDYPEENIIEVSYILATFDPNNNHEIILKTKVPRDKAELASVCSVWEAANYQERECYDMLGVEFDKHPDHRRILCPDDWEGFPLRKDYKAAEKYRHYTIYPEDKMNFPEREFVDKQKADESATRPELNYTNLNHH